MRKKMHRFFVFFAFRLITRETPQGVVMMNLETSKLAFVSALADAQAHQSHPMLDEARAWLMVEPDLVYQAYKFGVIVVPFAQMMGHTKVGQLLLEEMLFGLPKGVEHVATLLSHPLATEDLHQAVRAHPVYDESTKIIVPSASFSELLSQTLPFFNSDDPSDKQNKPLIELSRMLSQNAGIDISRFEPDLRSIPLESESLINLGEGETLTQILMPGIESNHEIEKSADIGHNVIEKVMKEQMGREAAESLSLFKEQPRSLRVRL